MTWVQPSTVLTTLLFEVPWEVFSDFWIWLTMVSFGLLQSFILAPGLHPLLYWCMCSSFFSGVAANHYADNTQAVSMAQPLRLCLWWRKYFIYIRGTWCIDVVVPPPAESWENPIHLAWLSWAAVQKWLTPTCSNAFLVSLSPVMLLIWVWPWTGNWLLPSVWRIYVKHASDSHDVSRIYYSSYYNLECFFHMFHGWLCISHYAGFTSSCIMRIWSHVFRQRFCIQLVSQYLMPARVVLKICKKYIGKAMLSVTSNQNVPFYEEILCSNFEEKHFNIYR